MAASRPRRLCSPRRARYHPPLRRGGHALASTRTAGSRSCRRTEGHRLPARSTITRTAMPSRIVISTYCYKRPPRKAVPLEGPAIVRPGRRAAAEEAQRLIA